MPCVPAFIRGVVNLRGRILPVLDLKRFFDLPEKGITDLHRIIFVRGCEMEFGLLADEITGVRTIAERTLQPSLPTLTGIRADYLKGITEERLVVLNLEHVFNDPRIMVNEEVEG
ncbi:MAG: chemotaxis protein CheW [Chthoniobacteraceae bacterium]